jgi:peptidyl-prolyl cis-trans isomerase D
MNKVSSLLGGLAVIAIAIVFIVQFRPATGAQTASAPTCAVEIGGDCISSTHFWAAYRLLAPRNEEASKLKSMGLRRQTAEGLIERWLLTQDAKRLGISVSDDDLTAELVGGKTRVSLPADKMRQLGYALRLNEDMVRFINVKNRTTKKFDAKQYEKEVRFISKMSPADFRDFQRAELTAARMRDLIRARTRVGENEAFEQFAHEKSTAAVSYVKLERRFYADVAVDSSDKAVDAWAEANKDELDKVWESRKAQFTPECRVARHILAKLDAETEPEAAKASAKKRIEAAVLRLKNGDAFSTVARELSDDTSAGQGGDLGCSAKGKMVKPFEDALFALEEGKQSGIVETEYGFHVIKLEKIAKGEEAEKIGRRQTARELHLTHEAERMAAEAAKEILGAVQGGKSLEDAVKFHVDALASKHAKPAKKKDGESKKETPAAKNPVLEHKGKPSVETTLPFNVSGDPIQGVKPGTNVAQMAFALDKPGAVPNDVVPLENGGYAVIQLKEKIPASKDQWEKEREFYMSAMRAAKQNDALIGYVKRLRSTMGTEVKLNQTLVNEASEEKGDDSPPEEPEE